MKCEMKGCNDEFIDSVDGLAQMYFHMIAKHNRDEINGKGLSYSTKGMY